MFNKKEMKLINFKKAQKLMMEGIMYTLVKTQNEKTLVMAPFKIRPLFSHD
jgi:hypothetical protein